MGDWKSGLAVVLIVGLAGCDWMTPRPGLNAPRVPMAAPVLVADGASVDTVEIAPDKQFGLVDTSGDGRVDFKEFFLWHHHSELTGSEDQISVAPAQAEFRQLDSNRDGFLDQLEFWPLVRAASPSVKPSSSPVLQDGCEYQFKVGDRDGDGRLTLAEFLAVASVLPGFSRLSVPCTVLRTDGVRVSPAPCADVVNAAEAAFSRSDGDGDGALDLSELCWLNRELKPRPPSSPGEVGCKGAFSRVDSDQDAWIDYSEFLQGDHQWSVKPDPSAIKLGPIEPVLRERFTLLDRNRDGRLDVSEWCGDASTQPDGSPDAICPGWLFGERKVVSLEEYHRQRLVALPEVGNNSLIGELIRLEFAQMDQNRDGQVTRDEQCRMQASGERTCHGAFWPLPASEALRIDAYATWRLLNTPDRSGLREAGVPARLQQYANEARRLDTDGDGRISLQEERDSCAVAGIDQ